MKKVICLLILLLVTTLSTFAAEDTFVIHSSTLIKILFSVLIIVSGLLGYIRWVVGGIASTIGTFCILIWLARPLGIDIIIIFSLLSFGIGLISHILLSLFFGGGIVWNEIVKW